MTTGLAIPSYWWQTEMTRAELGLCDAERVVEWLRRRADTPLQERFRSEFDDDVVEATLLDRGEPAVDLALARYASSHTTIAALLSRGNPQLRLAVLGNTTFLRADFIDRTLTSVGFLSKGFGATLSSAELSVLLVNPSLPAREVLDALHRRGAWDHVDLDDNNLLALISMNPRLSWRGDDHPRTDFDATPSDLLRELWRRGAANELGSAVWVLERLPIDVDAVDPKTLGAWRPPSLGKEDADVVRIQEQSLARLALAQATGLDEGFLSSIDDHLRRCVGGNGPEWAQTADAVAALFNHLMGDSEVWSTRRARYGLKRLARRADELESPGEPAERGTGYRGEFESREADLRRAHPEWFFGEGAMPDPMVNLLNAIARSSQQLQLGVSGRIDRVEVLVWVALLLSAATLIATLAR